MRDTCHSAAAGTPHTCPVRHSPEPFSLPLLLANMTRAAASAAAAHSSAHTSGATGYSHDTDGTNPSHDTNDGSYDYDAADSSYAYDADGSSYAYDASYTHDTDDTSYPHDTDETSYDYDAADSSYADDTADDTSYAYDDADSSYSHDSEADDASYDYDDADDAYGTDTYEGDYDSTGSTDSTGSPCSDADSIDAAGESTRLGWGDVLRGLLPYATGTIGTSPGSAHSEPAARQHEAWARQLSELLSEKQYMLGAGGEADPCTQLRRSDATERWLQRSHSSQLRDAVSYVVCSLMALVGLCFAVATRKQMGCARETGERLALLLRLRCAFAVPSVCVHV
jgi:hypothetical protein